MKRTRYTLPALVALLLAFTAVPMLIPDAMPLRAQDGTEAVETTSDAPEAVDASTGEQLVIEETEPFPGVSMEMALALVTVLAPIVTWGFKRLANLAKTHIPKFLLPVIAGGVGLLLTWLVSMQTEANMAWYTYLAVGLAVVGFREFHDRLVVKPVKALAAKRKTKDITVTDNVS